MVRNMYKDTESRDDVSIEDVFLSVFENWKKSILIVLFFSFLAWGASRYIKDQFKADVVIAPVSNDSSDGLSGLVSQFGGVASLAGIDIGKSGTNKVSTNIAILKSRDFTNKFIKDNGLITVLFASKFRDGKWLVESEADIPTYWDAYNLFDKKIRKIDFDPKTGLITLSIQWTDPVLAKNWANALVGSANDFIREKEIREAVKSQGYLQEQISKTSVGDIKEILFRLIEKQIQTVTFAKVKDDYAFQVIDRAVAPKYKNYPDRALFGAIGGVLGCAVAMVFAYFWAKKKQRASCNN